MLKEERLERIIEALKDAKEEIMEIKDSFSETYYKAKYSTDVEECCRARRDFYTGLSGIANIFGLVLFLPGFFSLIGFIDPLIDDAFSVLTSTNPNAIIENANYYLASGSTSVFFLGSSFLGHHIGNKFYEISDIYNEGLKKIIAMNETEKAK